MTVGELIKKLQQYPADAQMNFYYAEGRHSELSEALYDPTFEYLQYSKMLEMTVV